jgi:acyl-[acyl-carrier-protein]-phospholipid O-acyltransferase/long-chain-fatty-acid--[acyl-carrier-protein] ligase
MAYARSKHASELMLPAEVVVLDKLPMLGSGKVDQLAVEKFVREQAAAKAAAAHPHDDREAQPHEAAE